MNQPMTTEGDTPVDGVVERSLATMSSARSF